MAVVWCEGGMVNTCRESLQSLAGNVEPQQVIPGNM